jgi:hypothetical protein
LREVEEAFWEVGTRAAAQAMKEATIGSFMVLVFTMARVMKQL